MATNPILGRDVYLALAAVGWSDGLLDPAEADAIVRTALEEGLELDEIHAIEEATKTPIELSVIDRLTMTKSDRLYVYAVASWITRLDGVISVEEEEALARIGDALGIPEGPRQRTDEVVAEVAGLPEGDRPDRFDLARLRATIDQRLSAPSVRRPDG
jgi:uncharacterized membrane protein YebE (DUF533 family)